MTVYVQRFQLKYDAKFVCILDYKVSVITILLTLYYAVLKRSHITVALILNQQIKFIIK